MCIIEGAQQTASCLQQLDTRCNELQTENGKLKAELKALSAAMKLKSAEFAAAIKDIKALFANTLQTNEARPTEPRYQRTRPENPCSEQLDRTTIKDTV